jgi:hypothetical protein
VYRLRRELPRRGQEALVVRLNSVFLTDSVSELYGQRMYMEGLRKATTLCKVIRCQECFEQTHCLEHYPHIGLLDIRTNIY